MTGDALHPLFPFMSIPRVIRQTHDGGRPSGIQMVDPYHPSQKISRHLVDSLAEAETIMMNRIMTEVETYSEFDLDKYINDPGLHEMSADRSDPSLVHSILAMADSMAVKNRRGRASFLIMSASIRSLLVSRLITDWIMPDKDTSEKIKLSPRFYQHGTLAGYPVVVDCDAKDAQDVIATYNRGDGYDAAAILHWESVGLPKKLLLLEPSEEYPFGWKSYYSRMTLKGSA